jgi:glycosyltransferase involved in cell wall biosynthesis
MRPVSTLDAVRFLLVNNHCISDPIAGVTQSLRTIVEWLADAGHDCHVLTTARFESPVTFTIEEHLAQQGVPAGELLAASGAGRRSAKAARATRRPVVRYAVRTVPVTLLLTRHNDERRPDRGEAAQFLVLFNRLLDEHRPDVLIAANGHPMIFEALREARRRSVITAFAVRGYGYYEASYFEAVNHVFTCSRFLSGVYRDKIGLVSTPLEPPIDWSTVVAPEASRAFVTFVNPVAHKGLLLFARLAEALGARRPDIPVLVVQSSQSAGALNNIPGIDFSKYPQIMAAPPVPSPADYFALTRLLLVPSIWDEPFGRVAAESMINGIPPLVSNRGALPDVLGGDAAQGGGGRVLPIPPWMTPDTIALPTADEIAPWFDAVCALWDDAAAYRQLADRARRIAEDRYAEEVSRRLHVNYFTSLAPRARPLPAAPPRA